MNTIQPEDLPTTRSRRALANAGKQASIMENGVIVLSSPENGIECVLNAQESLDLLALLQKHRKMLSKLAQQG